MINYEPSLPGRQGRVSTAGDNEPGQEDRAMENRKPADLARAFYAALAAGDRDQLDALLHPEFTGRIAEGMPFGIGGQHDGPAAMRRNAWGAIARHFEARAEADRFLDLADGRLLVTGRYRGRGRQGGDTLDADFAHLITVDQGRIRALEQYTDTARWREAAGPLRTVLLDFTDGVATLRLSRPDNGNAINPDMAADLAEAATQIAENASVRAVLIAANGPNFTVGGDLSVFAETAREQLPNQLRRMIDSFHLAIERLTSIDAPIVAAVRGGAAGGGLGLLYAADIAVAADDARFAIGYGALGLTADGGNTWFLPRMVGMRRAQELFLLNRRLTAQEALEFGLVSRLAPSDAVETEAAALVATLAAGPTRAYGAVRRMLRQSFETGLSDQLDAEKESLVAVSATSDAQEGIAAFVAKRRPQFRGG
jgi:2-(1,2-epoxy-1,2-dihydrophenyl)acetyl-CoA isomerase